MPGTHCFAHALNFREISENGITSVILCVMMMYKPAPAKDFTYIITKFIHSIHSLHKYVFTRSGIESHCLLSS